MTTIITGTTTISSRSRNLGYGWTNQPYTQFNSRGESLLRVSPPDAPSVTGGPATIERELKSTAQGNRGNAYVETLFVGEQRVHVVRTVQSGRNCDGFDNPQWMTVGFDTTIRAIMRALRDGAVIEVRLDAEEV